MTVLSLIELLVNGSAALRAALAAGKKGEDEITESDIDTSLAEIAALDDELTAAIKRAKERRDAGG